MAHAQYLAFTSPSPLDLTKRVMVCLAAMQASAKQKKVAEPPPCTAVQYERADESRYTAVLRETCIVDSKTTTWLRFQKLTGEWKKQRGSQSSINETVVMPAYQEIIGMGEKAVPFLIAQLASEGDQPDQWFWALRAITGENPVTPEEQGNFKKMAKAWIRWSEQNVW